MITGKYLEDCLDELVNSSDDLAATIKATAMAKRIEDAVEHDAHDTYHVNEQDFRMDCWFCWKQAQQPGYGWPFDCKPERKIEETETRQP